MRSTPTASTQRRARRHLLGALASAPLAPVLGQARAQRALPDLHVHKSPTCGCCKDWIKPLEASGFKLTFTDLPDSRHDRAKLGMPAKFASCHTALVDGFVIEGHGPAKDIEQLVRSRPDALGLAVPGMDGPEYEGMADPYDVLLVQADGRWRVFSGEAGK